MNGARVALLMVEGFMARERNQDICVNIYSHLLTARPQPLPLQSLFTDKRIANAVKFVNVIDFLEEETKIYRTTVYIARDYSIFSGIFFFEIALATPERPRNIVTVIPLGSSICPSPSTRHSGDGSSSA